MKVCSRCNIEKEDSEFRIRKEKRVRNPFNYLNNECIKCDKERAAVYYAKKKNDEDFKEKNRQRVRAYAHANPDTIKMRRQTEEYAKKHAKWAMNRYYRMKDIVAAKMKVKRQTPEYKAMMKAYREKNKEKIRQQEIITKRRYQENNSTDLTDKYLGSLLATQGLVEYEDKLKYPELIEAKRLQILIKRKIKNHGTN